MSGDPREEVEKRLRESGFYDSPDEIRAHVDALAARVHGVTADTDTIRGGLDSLAWLLNNADKHGSPTFVEFAQAAREDRDAALAALDALAARVAAAETERDAAIRFSTRDLKVRDEAERKAAKLELNVARAESRLAAADRIAEALAKVLDPGCGSDLEGVILGGWASSMGFTDAISDARAALAAWRETPADEGEATWGPEHPSYDEMGQ